MKKCAADLFNMESSKKRYGLDERSGGCGGNLSSRGVTAVGGAMGGHEMVRAALGRLHPSAKMLYSWTKP